MFTPRSDNVLMRWRNCCGRAVGGEVRRAVLVAVRMAIKASRAKAGNLRAAILGRIELLLREGRQQQAQPFQLPGSEKAIEQLVIIGERDQLALRDIAQIGARGQVDGWRKRGQEVIRQIEIYVERVRSRPSWFLIASIKKCGKTKPPRNGWDAARDRT